MVGDTTIKTNQDIAHSFAKHFQEKVDKVVKDCKIVHCLTVNQQQYDEVDFLTHEMLSKIVKTIKPKKSFGFDRVPTNVLLDSMPVTSESILLLYRKILASNEIPEQWKIARIIPVYKKGDKKNIENYRPISNLCAMAKLFERFILAALEKVENKNEMSLTGQDQHGFKKGHSTVTAMLQIQAKMGDFLESKNLVALTSLDLSCAFDVVNHSLLVNKLREKRLPYSLVNIVENWLQDRSAYVEVYNEQSDSFRVPYGTVQGSVLGPILFAIYISDIFEVEPVVIYADDNYLLTHGDDERALQVTTEVQVNRLVTWLKSIGMCVNSKKTETIVFSRNKGCLLYTSPSPRD